jgi:hypothetical protein
MTAIMSTWGLRSEPAVIACAVVNPDVEMEPIPRTNMKPISK